MGGAVSEQELGQHAEPQRQPCPRCGALIVEGARKCRACKSWLVEPPRPRPRARGQRALALIVAAVVAVLAVLVSQRPSPVGEAPPLTPLARGSAVVSAQVPTPGPLPAGAAWAGGSTLRADPSDASAGTDDASGRWRARTFSVDRFPLDVAFGASGQTLYVSGDDASLWEYDLRTGKVLHMAMMPAQGDRLVLLADRYLAIVRLVDAGHVPVLDTQHWERDPALVYVGGAPADILALDGGKSAIAASSRGRRLTLIDLASSRPQADIQLPYAIQSLFALRSGARQTIGAMGQLSRMGDPAGAWLDIIDPTETPFGATRRGIAVGREPRAGAVTRDGAALFLADRIANTATLLRVDGATDARSVAVGQSPEAAFILGEDRFGVTINSKARTASVVDLLAMKLHSTLMLAGSPGHGAAAQDGSALFVSLGGPAWPPDGSGAAVIAGTPPHVVASFDTERGAARVAVAPGRARAAIASYWGKSVMIVER